jgi:hypothetical protein
MEGLVLLAIAAGVYFLPAIIAGSRNRASGAVFVLNLFLGWTLIGWVVALAWSLTERTARERGDDVVDPRLLARATHTTVTREERRPCPQCAELIKLAATKCRFCGAEVTPV